MTDECLGVIDATVTKSPTTGEWLAQTFSAGTFNAYGQDPNGQLTTLQQHTIPGAQPGSIEAVFDATGQLQTFVDTRKVLTGGPAAAPLRRGLSIRGIGSSYGSATGLTSALVLPDDYDILFWFRNTTASRLSLSSGANLGLRINR